MLLVQKDKKSSGKMIDFVMLKEIGSSFVESLNIQKIIDVMKEISPFVYNGSIKINSSKSYFQRAIAFSCLSNSNCIIHGDSNSDDIKVALKICSEIGFDVVLGANSVILNKSSNFDLKSISVNVGESGLCARMFGVVLASIFENTEILWRGYSSVKEDKSVIS